MAAAAISIAHGESADVFGETRKRTRETRAAIRSTEDKKYNWTDLAFFVAPEKRLKDPSSGTRLRPVSARHSSRLCYKTVGMSVDAERNVALQIGHVLFIDIVAYSKLVIDEQKRQLQQLNTIVRNTEQVRAAEGAGKLIRLPTGDGMVLTFFTSADAPVRCAAAISKTLKEYPEDARILGCKIRDRTCTR